MARAAALSNPFEEDPMDSDKTYIAGPCARSSWFTRLWTNGASLSLQQH